MKFIRKGSGILLALCVTIGLMPAAAFAAQNYELWVNNEQITSDNLSVKCGDGTAVYDPSANTLTLTDAKITTGCTKDWLNSGILSRIDGLKIVLSGANTITNTGGEGISTYQLDESYQQVPHDLAISGSGTLTISQNTASYGYGLYCTGNLTVERTTLDITSAMSGLWANQNMLIKDSKVTIKAVAVDTNVMGQTVQKSGNGLVTNTGMITVTNSSISASSALMAAILLGNDTTPGALILNSGSLALSGVQGINSIMGSSTVTLNGGNLDITATDQAVTVEDITYNNRMQPTSGALTGTSCLICIPITLPVYTIESAADLNYVLREGLSAVFAPGAAVTATDTEDSKSLKIDYYNPMLEPEGLDSGYTKLVEYHVQFSEQGYDQDTLPGTITLPLPNGYEGSTAKIIGDFAPKASSSTATTVSFPLTLKVDKDNGSVSLTGIMIEYKRTEDHSHTVDRIYHVTAGADSAMTVGSGTPLSVTTDGPIIRFIGVEVDGQRIDSKNYTVAEGSSAGASTVIELSGDYLNTLTVGTHQAKFVYSNGAALTQFTMKSAIQDIAGNTRYDTMKEIVNLQDVKTGSTVIVASGENFPDALAASGLAGCENATILLTEGGKLSDSANELLTGIQPSKVILIGGESAVSTNVENAIRALVSGVSFTRIGGTDRLMTAEDIYGEGSGWSNQCIITTGYNFADAISAAPYAYAAKCPIFLTKEDGTLDEATVAAIKAGGFTSAVIVGGTAVVSDAVIDQIGLGSESVVRLGKVDRYLTSSYIADWATGMTEEAVQPLVQLTCAKVCVVSGENYPDALAGSSFAGKNLAPMLLVTDGASGQTVIDANLKPNAGQIGNCYILGGTGAVSQVVRDKIADVLYKK